MIVVTGGAFQNKTKFASGLTGIDEHEFLVGGTCGAEALFQARAVRSFHLLVRRLLSGGTDIEAYCEQLFIRNPRIVIVTDEIGCGVVPSGREERRWREAAGRAVCILAEHSDAVYRVLCGIGRRIA